MVVGGMEYDLNLQRSLFNKPWVVYCKTPFGGSKDAMNTWLDIPIKLQYPITGSWILMTN